MYKFFTFIFVILQIHQHEIDFTLNGKYGYKSILFEILYCLGPTDVHLSKTEYSKSQTSN